jgi:prophage regulatory protein
MNIGCTGPVTTVRTQRFLRLPEVMQLVGLKKSTIYLYISKAQFPAPRKIGTRISVWGADEIHAWIEKFARQAA